MTKFLLSSECLIQLKQYEKIYVGFSGGLDSTVLLHNLAYQTNLAGKLVAVHINHGLSKNALSWQTHCQAICTALDIPLITKQVKIIKQANIEEQARKERYNYFSQLITANTCVLLAHHQDDQAETLLLQLFRGAGIDGLAAMAAIKHFAQGQLIRPFLHHSRTDLQAYAVAKQLIWIEDESNHNTAFSRNYIRQQLIPSIQTKWPAIAKNIERTTQHCQQAQANLDDLAKIDCPALQDCLTVLPFQSLAGLSISRLSNVLRFWLKINKVKLPSTETFNRLINEMIDAHSSTNPQIIWGEACIKRYQKALYLFKNKLIFSPLRQVWYQFPQLLYLENIGNLHARRSDEGLLISNSSLIEIRFRQGGERFAWRGQTKQLKKLLQEWQVPVWLRDKIPLIYVNDQLAAVLGYAISDHFYQKKSQEQEVYQLYLETL